LAFVFERKLLVYNDIFGHPHVPLHWYGFWLRHHFVSCQICLLCILEVSVQRVVLWLSNSQLSLIVLSGAFEINWGHHEQSIWLMKQGKIKSYAPVKR